MWSMMSTKKDNYHSPFGSSIMRFDKSSLLKEIFNNDPGPGSYSETSTDD